MSEQEVAQKTNDYFLEEDTTLVHVVGTGGMPLREQRRGGEWWASIYTTTQNAKHGALFCTFAQEQADCYFKNIDGEIIDDYRIRR